MLYDKTSDTLSKIPDQLGGVGKIRALFSWKTKLARIWTVLQNLKDHKFFQKLKITFVDFLNT